MCLWHMTIEDGRVVSEWVPQPSHLKCQQPCSPALLHSGACQACGSGDELGAG